MGSRVVRDGMRPATEGHSAKHREMVYMPLLAGPERKLGDGLLVPHGHQCKALQVSQLQMDPIQYECHQEEGRNLKKEP